jgi:putative glutamine amidotransferase
MSTSTFPLRIGIYGPDDTEAHQSRGCSLWPVGYAAAVTTAGGTPVAVERLASGRSWGQALEGLDGLVFLGWEHTGAPQAASEERLCQWCRDQQLPFLGVDRGLHVLNTTYGGTLYQDLPRELPQALQHRHRPEPGVRHAINVVPGTRLARCYGEGEIVVNSEHRRAVCKVARGFRVSAQALDGVIEAIEAEEEGWFALGVQWHPASASASGLDIQLFRDFVEACRDRRPAGLRAPQLVAG